MTNRDCATLGLRLLGAWLVASGLIAAASVPYFFGSEFDQFRSMSVGVTLLPAVVSVGLGALAWLNAEPLARVIFPEVSGSPDRLRAEKVFSLALAVIGALLVADAVPAVVNGSPFSPLAGKG